MPDGAYGKKQNARRDYDQEFWWKPGAPLPESGCGRMIGLTLVHPNGEDKYSDRDNEKKDSGQDPVIQGV